MTRQFCRPKKKAKYPTGQPAVAAKPAASDVSKRLRKLKKTCKTHFVMKQQNPQKPKKEKLALKLPTLPQTVQRCKVPNSPVDTICFYEDSFKPPQISTASPLQPGVRDPLSLGPISPLRDQGEAPLQPPRGHHQQLSPLPDILTPEQMIEPQNLYTNVEPLVIKSETKIGFRDQYRYCIIHLQFMIFDVEDCRNLCDKYVIF